uniref:mannose-6-phosphate isomerase n=2 Tax=Corethron hystrix TaxID=216773 RepID=A0A7S1BQ30_9STRA|mmetsp:Transcript_34582/g.79956  ORF Transcript_34582/g.79956 Transcript_34582/m.79956 type:complete len:601 (+) Transcript_34582:212-2014(+)|eukprot:CAMPEP_0113307636 /NCGR_PEP_ID=MMETSP0010_2-20120614/6405_1 /TAXON_ID=216773 ORGANISM="Corethron hystrix, Strain 308" /NCGR_SAMPLE_ID=MMETSP0010_2 /ASSEMBLY_ACC=CAM_ASM_000155 /LENGTH=600 /DNA_ID=CAMNT_0000162537 /DNA_START=166 /DNA_END=1968 /DNA_ORIENTATION=+ /assembly_acc=CAM_ASM_000155
MPPVPLNFVQCDDMTMNAETVPLTSSSMEVDTQTTSTSAPDSNIETTTHTNTSVSSDGVTTTVITTTIVMTPRRAPHKPPTMASSGLVKAATPPPSLITDANRKGNLIGEKRNPPHTFLTPSRRVRPLQRSPSQLLRLRRASPSKSPPCASTAPMRLLSCVYQKYAWGKKGAASSAGNMVTAASRAHQSIGLAESFELPADVPVAEMWMGTHPSGMSKVLDGEYGVIGLKEYVQSDPATHLGSDDGETNDITFLFKVLSIGQVLSIQAHPDKHLAVRLHAARPSLYKDPNHKPEMAIALTDDTSALMGFRPMPEIYEHMLEYKEFAKAVGSRAVAMCASLASKSAGYGAAVGGMELDRQVDESRSFSALSEMFRTFVGQERNEFVISQVHALTSRLRKSWEENTLDRENELVKLILYLATIYPDDPCVLSPLFFNYVQLKRGQALYIRTNEPHAYISGELLECMATSDNVVRVGLTPKVKDTDTLLDMLTYRAGRPRLTFGERVDHCTTLYRPPVEDFCVETLEVMAGDSYDVEAVPSPSILLCYDGKGILKQTFGTSGETKELSVSFGMSVFISANTTLEILAEGEAISIARAMSNVYG